MSTPNPEQLRIIANVMDAVQKILGSDIELLVGINQDNDTEVSIGWDWPEVKRK